MGKFQSKIKLSTKNISEQTLRLFKKQELNELIVVFNKLSKIKVGEGQNSSNRNNSPRKMLSPPSRGLNEEQFAQYFSYPGVLRKQIFKVFDRNMDGCIDKEEFLKGLAMCCRGPIDEKLRFVFSMCDLNEDAYVDRAELKNVLTSTAFSSFALLQAVALEEDLKAQYRAAYIAHEKSEDGKRGEIERDQKELQLIEDKNSKSKAKLNGLKDDLVQEQDKLDKSQQSYNEKLEKIDSDIEDQQDKFKVKQQEYSKKVSALIDASKELKQCKFETKEENSLIEAIRGNIEDAKKRQDAAKDETTKYEKKITITEAALVAQKNSAAKEKSQAVMALGNVKKDTRLLNEKMTKLEARIDLIENQIEMVDKSIEKQKKVNEAAGISLMEVWSSEPEADTNGFDANKYAAGKLEKKGDTWLDSEAAMLNDAQNFVKSKMASMQKVLLNLKAVRSRVKALKKLDIELNQEIMADLQKKHDKLATGIEEANAVATKLANGIYGAGVVLRRAQKANRKALDLFRKQEEAKNKRLNDVVKDLKEVNGLIFDAKLKAKALFVKNKFCAVKLAASKFKKLLVEKNLDSERKELTELTNTLEVSKDKLERFKTELQGEQSGHEAEMAAIAAETGRVNDEYSTLKTNYNKKNADRKKKLVENKEKNEKLKKLQDKALGSEDEFEDV
eukprot:g1436.t1